MGDLKELSERGFSSPAREPQRAALAADLIIANAPDPVFVSDLEGRILEANEAVSQLLGLRRAEVLEPSVSRFIGPEETHEFMVALREVVERGVTRNVRLTPRSASGQVIPTTLNASALRDATGKVIGAIGILRDMRELDKARAYAESLIKNAPGPVFVSDLEGKILLANDAVFSLLGFRPDELIEQSLSRIISPEETRAFMAALSEVVEQGVTRNARLHPPERLRRGHPHGAQRLGPGRRRGQGHRSDRHPPRHARAGQGPRLCREPHPQCSRPLR